MGKHPFGEVETLVVVLKHPGLVPHELRQLLEPLLQVRKALVRRPLLENPRVELLEVEQVRLQRSVPGVAEELADAAPLRTAQLAEFLLSPDPPLIS